MDSSGGRATSIVAAVATAAGVCAAWYLATTQVKKRRASPLTQMKKRRTFEEEEHSSSQSETKFAIVDELLGADAFLDVVRLMPAASAARLARVSSAVHARLSDPSVVLWCAESRKKVLLRRAVAGDLPLAFTPDCHWTLERLHLCERPPRFPSVLFRFACDEVEDGTGPSSEISKVATLLRRHPKLRVRA